jgi:hypothetical protein
LYFNQVPRWCNSFRNYTLWPISIKQICESYIVGNQILVLTSKAIPIHDALLPVIKELHTIKLKSEELTCTSRKFYTWPHVTSHSQNSGTLKLLNIIKLHKKGIYEKQMNFMFRHGSPYQNNSLYNICKYCKIWKTSDPKSFG